MRAIFAFLSLIGALLVVGLLVKNQLAPDTAVPAPETTTIDPAKPTSPAAFQKALGSALGQARPMPEDAAAPGKP
jgi:hypothetical protein